MLDIFGNIAEQKIREAILRGETKNLPGEGKPLKIENFYGLPPEFIFAYTVLKNGGFLNLDDDENTPVPSTSSNINLPDLNPSNSTTISQEKTSVSLVSDEIISPNAKPSNPTKYIQEKALNYSVIRDCRRGKF